tara:strand:+ start:844 stop:1302 length:459 start_codon:yes stop_codon:yes gene_type:complete
MKKKTNIKTVIRNIVREEVALAIHEVITELKQPPQVMTAATGEIRNTTPNKKIVEKKQFSNNSILNEVMNETANQEEWETMGGGTYDSNKMNDVLASSYGNMMNNDTDTSNPNGNLAANMGVNPNDPSADFLKKDYRAVMKAVDEKAKSKRG